MDERREKGGERRERKRERRMEKESEGGERDVFSTMLKEPRREGCLALMVLILYRGSGEEGGKGGGREEGR